MHICLWSVDCVDSRLNVDCGLADCSLNIAYTAPYIIADLTVDTGVH